jgi:GTPase
LFVLDGLISLGQEVEEGNVEYKLKLIDPTPERFQHLVSQLKWRLCEGQGEALYEIGVEDNGFPKVTHNTQHIHSLSFSLLIVWFNHITL